MRDADEAIDRVMAGLREATPPEEMEGRLKERLRAARAGRLVGTTSQVAGRRGWAIAAALLLALSLLALSPVAGLRGRRVREARQVTEAPTRVGAPVLMGRKERAKDEPGLTAGDRGETGKSLRQSGARRAPQRKEVAELWREDRQFLRRMHPGSFPAPPQPLTAQEKLLVAIARRGDAATQAELDPATRAQRAAEEADAVMAFFEPFPPPQEMQADKKEERQ